MRDLEGHLSRGDSLLADEFEELRADVVLCDPPAGVRVGASRMPPGDPRWRLLGTLDAPPSRAADFAWLAHCIAHLRPGGEGYVLLPPGSLFRGGIEARFRAELLRQGTIKAIIALPPIAGANTLASSTVWMVRQPTANPAPVLLIDATNDEGGLTARVRDRIKSAVKFWRADPIRFEPTKGFATTMPVLELLAGDASLIPGRWVYEPGRDRPNCCAG